MKIDANDIIGKRFGHLLVISYEGLIPTPNGKNYVSCYKVKCDCGQVFIRYRNYLVKKETEVKGHKQSCGCMKIEYITKSATKHGDRVGKNRTQEYLSWCMLRSRCYNKNSKDFKGYGGRGIKVCDRWVESYNNFLFDMGRKPSSKHSIERVNNDGDYSPENCKWADVFEQCNNRRSSVFMEYKGKILTISQWHRELKLNITKGAFGMRLRRGQSIDEILRDCMY